MTSLSGAENPRIQLIARFLASFNNVDISPRSFKLFSGSTKSNAK